MYEPAITTAAALKKRAAAFHQGIWPTRHRSQGENSGLQLIADGKSTKEIAATLSQC